ncbi:MAG: hypothetical protein IKH18_10770 [Clostridia bacterium]|nr:hypothetical protein [Clostridia bacterium]
MNKEEILAKSQKENRGVDYVTEEVAKTGIGHAWMALYLLLALVAVIDAIVLSRALYEVFFVMCAAAAVTFGYKWARQKKRHALILAAIFGLGALTFLTLWILLLVKG